MKGELKEMAKAKRLPSGNWRVNLYIGTDINGKRKYKSFTSETKSEAEYAAASYKANKYEEDCPKNITVAKAIEKYIESRNAILSPSTIAGYKVILRNYMQSIMQLPISEITNIVLQKAVNDESLRLTPKTISNAYSLICKSIRAYKPTANLQVLLPQKQKNKYATPDNIQIKNILSATKDTPIEVPVLLSLWLSLRLSEICGLKWSDISDEHISVTTAKVYADGAYHEKTTKTAASTRQILLPAYIKEKLNKLPRRTDNNYVINLSGHAIYCRFIRILKKNNIPLCRFHDLRHANASVMLLLGIPDKYAMERGGWSTNSTLKNIYQQTFDSEQKAIAEKIDLYFNRIIENI